MATDPKRAVRRDDFIKSVRPDPKSTEDLVLLQGYIGDSDLDGHVRVYSNAALSDFIDLPEKDILYSEPVSKEENPLGGSRLWIKRTTVFTAGDPRHVNRIKSSFLHGDLVKAFANQGGRIPNIVGFEINSNFVVTGCGPVTEKFEDCAPTNNPLLCTILEPPQTIQASLCNITCPHNPCFPTRRIGCVSGRVFCQTCNQGSIVAFNTTWCTDPGIRTEVVNPTGPIHYGTAGYTGGFNPYQTGNYGY